MPAAEGMPPGNRASGSSDLARQEFVPIFDVQGAPQASPLLGETVRVSGIVTACDGDGFRLRIRRPLRHSLVTRALASRAAHDTGRLYSEFPDAARLSDHDPPVAWLFLPALPESLALG